MTSFGTQLKEKVQGLLIAAVIVLPLLFGFLYVRDYYLVKLSWFPPFIAIVGIAILIGRYLLAFIGSLLEKDDATRLDRLKNVSVIGVICFCTFLADLGLAGLSRAGENITTKFWRHLAGDVVLPVWARTFELKLMNFWGLFGIGGLLYLLKRKHKMWFGVSEILVAVIGNWTLNSDLLVKAGSHKFGASEAITVLGVFYVFTKGIGNVMEGLDEKEKAEYEAASRAKGVGA